MAVTTITPARALRQPRRIDVRAVGGLVLMALTVIGSLSFWGVTNDNRSVLLAARDMPAGKVLAQGDLTVASVRVDDTVYQAGVPADSVDTVVGKRLTSPVYAGQMLAQKQIASAQTLAAGQMAMTVPVSASAAATGILPQSDVKVLVTTDKGKPSAKTTVLLDRVRVLDVGYDQAQGVVNTGTGPSSQQQRISSLTLLLTADQGVQLAAARWSSDLDFTLLPPES